MDLVSTNVKKLFEAAELYQSVEVSPHLDMSFDTVERTQISYDTGDREQGPYLTSYEVEQEGSSGAGGVPGTDSNDEDITYNIKTDEGSSSTYALKNMNMRLIRLLKRQH